MRPLEGKMPVNGDQSFTYKPLTKAERELFAKTGQMETVPVVIARK
jgi:hypothetical protein